MDDGHRMAMGHPGASVIPAALATAERTGASGKEFLAALVAGYEVAVRASAARVPWYKDKMYSTGIWGVFGATAAAGKLLGLDDATLQSALGIAGSHGAFPPGGLQSNHAMVKETIAWSGMTGVSAALLARQNFVGPADFLDYSDRWDTSALVAGLGEPRRIGDPQDLLQAVRGVPLVACRRGRRAGAEAPAPAARRRDRNHRGRRRSGKSRAWRTMNRAIRLPRSSAFQFALAVALLYDRIGPAEVSDAHIRDPAILSLARKVRVSVDDALDRQFPAKTMARVTIRTPVAEIFGRPSNTRAETRRIR